MISLLGNTFSSSGGTMVPGQAQMVNGQLSNDGSSNDTAPFDMNDFPQLSARQNSSGGPQGQLASLRKQGVGVNSVVQQSQEFSIQNEDFPALPGFKGGNVDFAMDLHQKEQHHENAIAMMQPSHFPMSRSAGFALGGSYASHRQPQQQQQQQQQGPSGLSTTNAVAAFSGNSPDLLHLHGSDLFPSHGVSASYHSQVVPGLRSAGLNNTATSLGSYDQLIQQYQHHQNQSQFRLQQMSGVGQSARDQGLKSMQGLQAPIDKFGLLGLLGVIKMSEPDVTSLALGIDLTTLGLNLNSRENLYKTFGSPWSDAPAKGDPEYTLPQCYVQPAPRLQQSFFSKFQEETLFYIFYSMPNDEAQLYAANELYHRGWFYHKEHRLWFIRAPNVEPLVKTNTYERGSYLYFDPVTWENTRKDNFVVHYEMLENRPHLPQH
jgi:CCR4-NOT transcription complex subunit 2